MTDVLFYLTMFLSVVAVWLLWRVWRLEGDAKKVERRIEYVYDTLATRYNNMDVMFANRLRAAEETNLSRIGGERSSRELLNGRLNTLARALGYEWKRTDAKEGWEKKTVSPFGFGIGDYGAYKKALEHAINVPPIWAATREYDWTLPTTNRRKADRRKPTPQATPQASRKKPRRAH